MSGKYAPLVAHLEQRKQDEWQPTFAQIEGILGEALPPSARKYAQWWSNNPRNSSMTRAWLEAGWRSGNVNVPGERVTFRRVGRSERAGEDGESRIGPVAERGVLERLGPESRRMLSVLAGEDGASEAATAAALLTLALEEEGRRRRLGRARQALARLGEMQPVDAVALIRQGREAH